MLSTFVLLPAMTLAVLGHQAANADGELLLGNQNCAEAIPGALELRINAPADGTFPSGDGFSVTIDVQTLDSDVGDHQGNQKGGQVFDFTASGGSVIGAVVKGGPDANFYDYRPGGVVSGDNLHAPVNTSNKKFYGLSHLSFCYVLVASPSIETLVSDDDVTVGESFHDVATLSGGNNPTGTITFNLYGPDNALCLGVPVFTDTATVTGNGSYSSDPFTPTAVGTYRWIASYSGDSANNPVSGACNDAGETTVVQPAQPALVTTSNPANVTIGASFSDTATLSGGYAPTGTITFNLYGPNDADCSGAVVFTDTATVSGNGDYTSDPFTATVVGKYRWIASYSGDANNDPVSGSCNDANEDTTVDKFQPTMGLTNWLTPQARANVNLVTDPATGKVGDNLAPPADTTDDVRIVLYAGADCTGTVIHDEGFQVDPDGATTQAFTTNNTTLVEITANVSWSWKAFYEGDSVNSALETSCQNVSAAFSEF